MAELHQEIFRNSGVLSFNIYQSLTRTLIKRFCHEMITFICLLYAEPWYGRNLFLSSVGRWNLLRFRIIIEFPLSWIFLRSNNWHSFWSNCALIFLSMKVCNWFSLHYFKIFFHIYFNISTQIPPLLTVLIYFNVFICSILNFNIIITEANSNFFLEFWNNSLNINLSSLLMMYFFGLVSLYLESSFNPSFSSLLSDSTSEVSFILRGCINIRGEEASILWNFIED